jgi:hypothetical protein
VEEVPSHGCPNPRCVFGCRSCVVVRGD